MGVIVWSPLTGGWLAGRYRKGQALPQTGRASRIPDRFDPSLTENQLKLDAVEQLIPLAEAEGISLAELGVAWTLVHPAVTSAIIGPRTQEQLEGLTGVADVSISPETLDQIDKVVPPGSTLNRADLGFENIYLRPGNRRS